MAIRCAGCHRRLADVVNEVEAGQVLIELKCPRCRQPHLEVIRPLVVIDAEPRWARLRASEKEG
jgi:phage FluMu protein Com